MTSKQNSELSSKRVRRGAVTRARVVSRAAFLTILLLWAATATGQIGNFGGPSILSRGGANPGQRGNTPLDFTVVGALAASLTTNATGVGVGKDIAYGGTASVAVTGSHSWRSSFVGLDYYGSYHQYSGFNAGSGASQSLALQYDRRLSKRLVLNLRETATMSKLAVGGLPSYGFFTNDLIGVPVNSIFDSYLYSNQSSAGVTWQPRARLAISLQGDVFQVHRSAGFLVGVRGYRAGASTAYKFSRSDDLSVGYSFVHFSFPRAFGASDLHGAQLGWNHRFDKRWSGQLGVGGFRVETLGTQQVTLPPEVAEILGRTSGIRAVYRIGYAPNLEAGVNYAYDRSNFTLGAASSVSPGNGVYLTSKTRTANLGYSYSGFRKASFSANFGYAEYSSLYQEIGKYGSWLGGCGTGYRISDHISLTASYDVRRFEIETGKRRLAQTVNLGIAVAPYRVPLPAF